MVRGCAIFSAIWTAAQAVAYIVLASLGYNLFFTKVDLVWDEAEPMGILAYVFNLVYFFNVDYDTGLEMDLHQIDNSIDSSWGLILTYNSTPETATRTNQWMLAYLILSSMWVATSVLLFIGTVMDSTGKMLAITVIPWVLVAAANIVADVTASVTFGLDIADTSTFQKLIKFLEIGLPTIPELPDGVTLPPNFPDIPKLVEEIDLFGTWLPSLVMVAFFSRVVIIFFVNLFLLFFVPIEAKKRNNRVQPKPLMINQLQPLPMQQYPQQYPQQHPQQYPQHQAQQTPQPPYAPWSRDSQTRSPLQPLAAESLTNVYGSASQNGYGNKPPNSMQNGYRNGMQNDYSNRHQNGHVNKPPPTAKKPMSVDRLNQYDPPGIKKSDQSYPQDSDTESWLARHNGSTAGNGSSGGNGNAGSSGSAHEGSSGHGSTHSSYSNPSPKPVVTEPISVLKKEKPESRNANPGPDELRSQLPWSYFSDLREAPRPVVRRELDGDLPPMPPPDYTLRFKQARRTEVGRSSQQPT